MKWKSLVATTIQGRKNQRSRKKTKNTNRRALQILKPKGQKSRNIAREVPHMYPKTVPKSTGRKNLKRSTRKNRHP